MHGLCVVLHLQRTRLAKLLNDFLLEMERGLAGEESSMKMITSYVTQLATGSETGAVSTSAVVACWSMSISHDIVLLYDVRVCLVTVLRGGPGRL